MEVALAAAGHISLESFFTTLAESAAALLGLLFVALTLDASRANPREETAAMETRAGAALLCFLNVLTTSLLALIPGDDPGVTAIVFSLVGGLYVAASIGPLTAWALGADAGEHRGRTSRWLIIFLGLAFTVEFVFGVLVVLNEQSGNRVEHLADVLVGLLLIGISRTWEIVGVRDPGVNASLRLITRRFRRR